MAQEAGWAEEGLSAAVGWMEQSRLGRATVREEGCQSNLATGKAPGACNGQERGRSREEAAL